MKKRMKLRRPPSGDVLPFFQSISLFLIKGSPEQIIKASFDCALPTVNSLRHSLNNIWLSQLSYTFSFTFRKRILKIHDRKFLSLKIRKKPINRLKIDQI